MILINHIWNYEVQLCIVLMLDHDFDWRCCFPNIIYIRGKFYLWNMRNKKLMWDNRASTWENVPSDICIQRRLKSVCTSASLRVFVVSLKDICILSYRKCAQWQFRSVCANVQDIWILAGCTCPKVRFLTLWHYYLSFYFLVLTIVGSLFYQVIDGRNCNNKMLMKDLFENHTCYVTSWTHSDYRI